MNTKWLESRDLATRYRVGCPFSLDGAGKVLDWLARGFGGSRVVSVGYHRLGWPVGQAGNECNHKCRGRSEP